MIINGVEIEDLNVLDAKVAENFEKVSLEMQNINEKVEGMSLSESIRTQCNIIFRVFNNLFGEGTDKKIFGDEVNLLICVKAFDELITQINDKNSDAKKITTKYSPSRAARKVKK